MSVSSAMTTAGLTRDGTHDFLNCDSSVQADGTIDGETVIISGRSGRIRPNGSGGVVIRESTVRLLANGQSGSYGRSDSSAPLTYMSSGEARSSSKNLDVYNSHIIYVAPSSGSKRQNTFQRHIKNSVYCDSAETRELFIYTKGGAELEDVLFRGVRVWEIYRAPAYASNVTVDNCACGFLNWEAGPVDLYGFNLLNWDTNAAHGWIAGNTSDRSRNLIRNWNKGANFENTKLALNHSSSRYEEGLTICWVFVDSDGDPVEDVKVVYSDDRSTAGTYAVRATYVTGSDGVLEGVHNSRLGSDAGSSRDEPVLFIRTARAVQSSNGANPPSGLRGFDSTAQSYDIVNIQPRLEIRAYHYLLPTGHDSGDDFSLVSPIGKISAAAGAAETVNFRLTADPNITESKATVDAYTELDTAEKLYHRMVSMWYDSGHPRPSWNSGSLETNDVDLVLLSPSASGYAAAPTLLWDRVNSRWVAKVGETFTGRVVAGTGTITRGAGITVVGDLFDVHADASVRFVIPAEFGTTVSVYTTAAAADAGGSGSRLANGVSLWPYLTGTYGGSVVWLRLDASDNDGEAVVSLTVPSTTGPHTENVLITAAAAADQKTHNLLSTLQETATEARDWARTAAGQTVSDDG